MANGAFRLVRASMSRAIPTLFARKSTVPPSVGAIRGLEVGSASVKSLEVAKFSANQVMATIVYRLQARAATFTITARPTDFAVLIPLLITTSVVVCLVMQEMGTIALPYPKVPQRLNFQPVQQVKHNLARRKS